MSASASLLSAIKATLRGRGMTYRELARLLDVSHATVKRDLSKGNFSLRRLDQICTALSLSLDDLTRPPAGLDLITELSETQELALISHPKLFVVTYLLVNDWKFRDIVEAFRMTENELIDILLRLDRLKIIEYRPPHRVRKLTARNFAWRKDGPVHSFFVTRFVPEFFQSAFAGPGDAFRFVGGMLSAGSLSRFKASLERLAVEYEELARGDARLPLAERDGCSAILAVRSWEFSEFTRLRRRAT
ncbi:MAG TPA: helix-turn-helix transcriptional regulator [Steroidobacteraceae bacterium]|nr:helix-turn-helix transcriptional regulator [Steroidobacteraceae bacterium]